MAEAIILRRHGDADALKLEPVAIGAPGPGELRIKQTAIGVNFHDIYVRTGLYRTLALPGTPGLEAVGTVEAIGPQVRDFAVGDRVGYITRQYGAYATSRILPAELALRLPDALDDRLAATVLLKALTAHMLVFRVHRLEAGMTILVHAAAGGVGRLLCQWAARLGVTVIGTVGSEQKSRIAFAAGCSHTITYRSIDFVKAVNDITAGRGVDVVYDSVGQSTFDGSLDALTKRGHLINFGQSSGPIAPFDISRLAPKSTTLTRPILFHYMEREQERKQAADAVFSAFVEGILTAQAGTALPLAQAAAAHKALESRSTEGPFILIPGPDGGD